MLRSITLSIGLSLAILACTEIQHPQQVDLPLLAISDGAHDGREGFYFLPPLVPNPEVGSSSDGSLLQSLIVSVCEWGGTCSREIAEFSAEFGAGTERLRFEEDHYLVNWHTTDFALDESKNYRIRVSLGSFELGFADVDIVASGKELRKVDTGEFIALKNGRTLPIKFKLDERRVSLPPIAFSSDEDGDWDVYTINPDGSGRLQLSNLPGDEREVSWSPDGSRLAVRLVTAPESGDIWVVDALTGVGTQLTNTSATDRNPDWSPDGSQIVFSRNYSIHVMNSDGSNVQRISDGPDYGGPRHGPASWSPDGSVMAVQRNTGSGQSEIFLMDPDGSNLTQLTSAHLAFNSHPTWSPDGGTIYSAARSTGDPAAFELYEIDVVTGNMSLLVDLGRTDVNPEPSPTGDRVVFSSNYDGTIQLYMIDLATRVVTQLTGPTTFVNADPSWRR